MKFGVIDCGTNTFHVLVAEVGADRSITPLYKERRYVRLGQDGLHHIGPEPFRRGLECLRVFRKIIDQIGVVELRVFGTEALRRATNGTEFIQAAQAETGLRIDLISGDEEARLIHLGVRQAVPDFAGKAVIMDIGGGSVEVIVASSREVFWSQSFPLGVQVLFSKFHQTDPLSAADLAALQAYLRAELQPLLRVLRQHKTVYLIGASGSYEVIEDMLQVQRTEGQLSTVVRVEDFYEIYPRVLHANAAERGAMPGIPPERVELIVVAFVLIEFIIRQAGSEQLLISSYAMKEGMLWEMYGQHTAADPG